MMGLTTMKHSWVNYSHSYLCLYTPFRKLDLVPSSSEWRKTPIPFGPSGRANLNHLTTLSMLMLRPKVSLPVYLGFGHPLVGPRPISIFFFADDCLIPDVGCPLWREDGSVICSPTLWSETRRIYDHSLLFHLRVPLFTPPYLGTGLPFHRLSPLAGLQCLYSHKPPHGVHLTTSESELRRDWRSVSQYVLVPSPLLTM
jgi:hypothetical protein